MSYAQSVVVGRVMAEGEALPFANVFIENTTIGTATNQDGSYQLLLPAVIPTTEKGIGISFNYVGFVQQTHYLQPTANSVDTLHINLKAKGYELQGITVSASDEDPAYDIIKAAIKMRKHYLAEIQNFSTSAYVKGVQSIKEAPVSFLGQTINIEGLNEDRSGIVYLSETISDFSFRYPNDYKEVIQSSKVSGDDSGFSFNRASAMYLNFYENKVSIDALSKRGYISPVAYNALFYYRYRLMGTHTDKQGRQIHKIKVIPKRPRDPAFSGFIYIEDAAWRINSLRLGLYKSPSVEFVDSLIVSQNFAPTKAADTDSEIWVLLSQQYDFAIQLLTFKLFGTFVGVYSDYTVNKPIPKRFFNNEIVRVLPEANQHTERYWQEVRPMPLTETEAVDYQRKDSIALIKKSKVYLDSIDRRDNKFNFFKPLLTGYMYNQSYLRRYWYVPPLINILQYNTIEGWRIDAELRFSQEGLFGKDRNHRFISGVGLRYGLSNKRFNARMQLKYYANRRKLEQIDLGFGRRVSNVNSALPVSERANTILALFRGENPLKLYENAFVEAQYQRELINGLLIKTGVQYENRLSLENTTSYSFISDKNTNFTPNIDITDHKSLVYSVELNFTPKQKYELLPYNKNIIDGKQPTLQVYYRQGLPILGSDTEFIQLQLGIKQYFSLGILGSSQYHWIAGSYLNRKSIYYPDRTWVNSNHGDFIATRFSSFRGLPLYAYASQERYTVLLYEHHFDGFIWNKLPYINRLKWRVIAGSNMFLASDIADGKIFVESLIGVENILKIIRVDYTYNWQNADFNGWRLGLTVAFGN